MKKSSRKKRSGRRRRKKREITKKLKRRVKKNFSVDEMLFGSGADGVKMSAVLEAFIEPYVQSADTEEKYRKLLDMAIFVWNLALVPFGDREEQIGKIVQAFPQEIRADGEEIIREMLARKEEHFSDNRRLILDYEMTDMGDAIDLQVVSTANNAELER
jgi:hypothetical protein